MIPMLSFLVETAASKMVSFAPRTAAAFWIATRGRYTSRRTTDQRFMRRDGCTRPQAGRRDPIYGVHLSVHRSIGEPCFAAAQSYARPTQLSDGSAYAPRRRHSRSRASLGKHRGYASPHSRSARGDTVFAGTRLWPLARRDPRS